MSTRHRFSDNVQRRWDVAVVAVVRRSLSWLPPCTPTRCTLATLSTISSPSSPTATSWTARDTPNLCAASSSTFQRRCHLQGMSIYLQLRQRRLRKIKKLLSTADPPMAGTTALPPASPLHPGSHHRHRPTTARATATAKVAVRRPCLPRCSECSRARCG